jgi:NAD(P)-dependent dehydrogenase (short-subunit alcohol dehydrogenase family)
MSPRVAIVTGGTRGIGRAIAERFAVSGFIVVATARRAPEEPLADGIAFMAGDVANAAAVRDLFAGIRNHHGRLDVLVNNAGLGGNNPLEGDDDALWHAILATNLNGTYYCSKAALPLLPDRTGRIVNIASVLALRGVPDGTAYCAAKHGVVGFTRALAHVLAPRGITVNAVCPGWVRTGMAARRFEELGIDEAAAAASTPTGRITTPEEIAALVHFLAGEAAGNITGQTITVDGGSLA